MNCSLFMGIRFLNQYFKKECKQGIQQIHLKSLSGKKIAVDTSIYLYKFLADGEEALIENLLTMLNLFKYYKITPIFIFDGKVPAEKKALLEKRKEDKKTAENEYYLLKDKMENTLLEKKGIQQQMDELKKKFVYLKHDQIEMVKKLFDAYGTDYIVSEKEADELCAYLVVEGFVWACLSEDMDMFVYGCHKVLRYFSLLNQSVVVYSMKLILEELGLTQKEFREICVLSGTDYNRSLNNNRNNLMNSLKMFKKYKKSIKEIDCGEKICGLIPSYYDWVQENNDCIEDYNMLMNIYDIFDLTTDRHNDVEIFENIKIMNGPLDMQGMKPLLLEEGFIF